jgi:uncharacterized protein
MRRTAMLAVLLFATAARAEAQEAELKAQFRSRLAAIEALKDAGKIGETAEGMLAVVDPRYSVEVAALIGRENRDRAALYQLIAARTGETSDSVAQQNAIRNYRDAKPDHYLRTKAGQWLKKSAFRGG